MSRLVILTSGLTIASFTIDPSKSFYENVMACRQFLNDKEIAEKAGKPVNQR